MDDSITDNVHIADSWWETNRHGLFWHITQRSHTFPHFSHQKSVAVSQQSALRQSCRDAQPYAPPQTRASDLNAEWTNPWSLVKTVRAKNLHVNCTGYHMSLFRRFNLRIWPQILRFPSGSVLCCRILLDRLAVVHANKKHATVYGIRKFITVFTKPFSEISHDKRGFSPHLQTIFQAILMVPVSSVGFHKCLVVYWPAQRLYTSQELCCIVLVAERT